MRVSFEHRQENIEADFMISRQIGIKGIRISQVPVGFSVQLSAKVSELTPLGHSGHLPSRETEIKPDAEAKRAHTTILPSRSLHITD